MHYEKKVTLFKINFNNTLQKIKAAIDQMPPQMRQGQPRKAIKGNVNATAWHIYRLFMGQLKKARHMKTHFRTTNPSLAKISNNCARTIQRHINKLIDLKIVLGKNRIGRGVELQLNQELLVFDTLEVKETPKTGSCGPDPSAKIVQNTGDLARQLLQKFAISPPRVAP